MAKKSFNTGKAKVIEPRINDEIENYDMIRLIYKKHDDKPSEEDFTKIVSMDEARKFSKKFNLDLVEINAKTNPPVIRLTDYSKYLWNLKKQMKNKNTKPLPLKEIQLSVTISDHDMQTKAKKAIEFVNSGYKVKVILMMRGRELSRREYSKESFYRFLNMISEHIAYDCAPKDEGNKYFTIIKRK